MQTTQFSDKLCLKNIYELLGKSFYISAYQRGYRWESIQVKELLDDIWSFTESSRIDSSSFYCLQPIVVVQSEKKWQVVDGQQRLTTLYLILHYLEQEHLRRPLVDAYNQSQYSLQYETRPQSAAFLAQVHKQETEPDNIDFFYMWQAYKTIRHWFASKDYNDNNKLLEVLLAKPANKRAVKVIWYDLSDECMGNDSHAIEVFSRINIGKIPLTNAELVRALFLQQRHSQSHVTDLKKIQIATEWDQIEQRLQEPDFWYFISHSTQPYATRIEYIFDLMKDKSVTYEPFFTFHQFAADFENEKIDVDVLWGEIKSYFLTFQEWFQDKELYHLIGFLVACGESVKDLKKASEHLGLTKSQFKSELRCRTQQQLKGLSLDDLEYGSSTNNEMIKKVLLLCSVETLLSNTEPSARFPFDRYKQERWDIEHIRSQSDQAPTGGIARQAWLQNLIVYFDHHESDPERADVQSDLHQRALGALESKTNGDVFTTLYQEVMAHFGENERESWLHSLGNLALLDSSTNRSYKNAPFSVKRARLIDNDKRGVFMPICTKNVFLKYYSPDAIDLHHWTDLDRLAYEQAIAKLLVNYLPVEGVHE